LTAAHCAKTLIISSISGNAALAQCSKILIPALIEYVAKMSQKTTGDISEAELLVMDEVWKAFSAIFMSVAEAQSRLYL